MNKFEDELKNGRFICSECQKCGKIVWPPSDFCNRCFGKVTWRHVSGNGRLIEFSRKGNAIFCIAEFEDAIRIMGDLQTGTKNPAIGQTLELVKCGYDGKEKFFFQLK